MIALKFHVGSGQFAIYVCDIYMSTTQETSSAVYFFLQELQSAENVTSYKAFISQAPVDFHFIQECASRAYLSLYKLVAQLQPQ